MEAVKRRARVCKDQLEWTDEAPALPDGEVEVILLYASEDSEQAPPPKPLAEWPALDGGAYLGGTLRREDFYGNNGR